MAGIRTLLGDMMAKDSTKTGTDPAAPVDPSVPQPNDPSQPDTSPNR